MNRLRRFARSMGNDWRQFSRRVKLAFAFVLVLAFVAGFVRARLAPIDTVNSKGESEK